ncbi:uncharacterized protein EV422DRAFT_498152 [Fimicolochytrium jonesii]|uniref:uncharacterized protein n=1 Tax=Fimicolochytrium jonesii TaxID=1396493 RepID=UPI0022FEA9FA|nr:uncharacterized protein EV422DRAFT_498152 [Fimicolochytrium jonesii]KAI8819143.1 hypothetical protein EV422DRAFT_498152 [Fimicolochytrium jonesii]
MSTPSVVLITGITARGLGASLAIQLAKTPTQYKVYGTLRSLAKAEEFYKEAREKGVEGTSVGILELDVTDAGSCKKAVQELVDKEGRIDVLVNNAGAGFVQTIESASEEQIQNCFDVNFFSAYRMCRLTIPHMRAQNSGRIINISSIGGLVGQPFNETYCAAKCALDSLAESFNGTLWKWNIHVSSFCPGAITSAFAGTAMKTLAGQDVGDAYKPVLDEYVKNLTARYSLPEAANSRQTPEECAADVVAIIEAERPKVRYATHTVKELVDKKFVEDGGDKIVGFLRNRYFPADFPSA